MCDGGGLNLSLKSKILLGLTATTLVALLGAGLGYWSLFRIENDLRALNEQQVPLQKVLSQLESHQNLFSVDVESALEQGRREIEVFNLQAIEAKLRLLEKFYDAPFYTPQINSNLRELKNSFASWALAAKNSLDEPKSDALKKVYSAKRSEFQGALRNIVVAVEQAIRENSRMVEARISQTISLIGLILGMISMFSAGAVLWLDRLLAPLIMLREEVRAAAERGLSGINLERLKKFSSDRGEIGQLAFEFMRMATTLIARSDDLEKERVERESAHQALSQSHSQLKLTQAKLRHEEKLGIIGRLSAQMAHEIRNPLNALGLHIDQLALELESGNSTSKESVEWMRREINRLAEISETYLNQARKPRVDLSENISVNDVINESVSLYRPMLEKRDIEIVMDLDEVGPQLLDEKKISLVMGNLLKNAYEALEGTENVQRKLIISSRRNLATKEIEIIVADNGPGIPEELESALFAPFTTTKAKGTGLGLSHSRQILEAHNGALEYLSSSRGGAIFRLRLPIQMAENVQC